MRSRSSMVIHGDSRRAGKRLGRRCLPHIYACNYLTPMHKFINTLTHSRHQHTNAPIHLMHLKMEGGQREERCTHGWHARRRSKEDGRRRGARRISRTTPVAQRRSRRCHAPLRRYHGKETEEEEAPGLDGCGWATAWGLAAGLGYVEERKPGR